MQKFGTVEFKSGRRYSALWTLYKAELERIELLEDLAMYNSIDTGNCIAAYFRRTRELVYGDRELLNQIFRARHQVLSCKAQMEQKTEVTEEGFRIIRSKIDEKTGFRYQAVLLNGVLQKEVYETPELLLEFDLINPDAGSNVVPINLRDYTVYGLGIGADEGPEADYYSLEYLRAKYDISHLDNCDYVVIDSMEAAAARLKQWKEAPTKLKAIDLETTGTETGMCGQDCITGIVLSYSEDDSTYFPFRQERCSYNLPIEYLEEIVRTVNSQPEDVLILAHNGKFEKEGVWKEYEGYIKYSDYAKQWEPKVGMGIALLNLRIDRDTYLLSTLVEPVMRKNLHTLKNRAYEATGKVFLELDMIFKDKIKFNVLPPEIIRYYACPDTVNTIRVYKYLLPQLPKDELNIFELECHLLRVKATNEFAGMRIRKEHLAELIENEEYKFSMLGNLFRQMHRTSANINSPNVKARIFYENLRCPVLVRTKTGQPSTSVTALTQIVKSGVIRDKSKIKQVPDIKDKQGNVIVKGSDLGGNKYPSLVILSRYNKASKELGALRRIERKSQRDRVMFGINQTGAGSGRQTSDAHQYSDAMKSLVVADSSRHRLWSADFKQIELRILAYLAGQEDLIKLASDPDIDIHRAILSIITGKPMWAISAEERKKGKAVNFGVVYMMTKYGLVTRQVGPSYTQEDLLAADKAIVDFYNGLPKVKALKIHNEEFVRHSGYVKTEMGRYRYFRDILDPTVPERQKASWVRAANNTPVQGFGADYLKIVECNIQDYIEQQGWDALVDCDGMMLPKVRLMLSIHDEVLVSTHESIPIEEIIKMFKVCMEMKIQGAPPFFASPAMVGNWYDGKNDAYEIPIRFRDQILEAWEKDRTSLLHVNTYLSDLNQYRVGVLSSYMQTLVKEYKTVDEVAEHVRDDNLTHVLISMYDKQTQGLGHLETIHKAVECYMADTPIEMVSTEVDKTAEEELIASYDELEKYIQVDNDGKAIMEEPEEEDDCNEAVELSYARLQHVEREWCIYGIDDVIIDLSDFDREEAEWLNQEIFKRFYSGDAYYHVKYCVKGENKLLASNIKVNYVPDEINALIKQHTERNVVNE